MTRDEYRELQKKIPVKRKISHGEDDLQMQCVEWFDKQYPKLKDYLIHIPNGGSRKSRISKSGKRYSPEAIRFKKMGVRPGVCDLFLALPNGRYHGLWIEMKFGDNESTKEQNQWQLLMMLNEYSVYEIRRFEAFQELIRLYLR